MLRAPQPRKPWILENLNPLSPDGISTASSIQLHTLTVLPFFRRPKREARLRGGRALSDQLDVLPFSEIGDVLPFWCHQLDVLPFQGSPGIRASLFWTVSSIRSTCFPFQWSGNDQGDVLPFSLIVTRKFEFSFKSSLTRHAKGKHEELGSSKRVARHWDGMKFPEKGSTRSWGRADPSEVTWP